MNKILIIEDDPAILMGLEELFKSENYNVITSKDGAEALQIAINQKPDLILLDINLPSLSGFDVCRKLREQKYFNSIIMLTSRSEQLDKIVGLEAGADDYIIKPFDTREVLARVRTNLRRLERQDKLVSSSTAENDPRRKLLSIMFSDMKDYSKKMHRDEDFALRLLKTHNEILSSTAKEHHGNVIETAGDSFLISFESALNALRCSIHIQEKLKNYNKTKTKRKRIEVRIGIHLGDVVEFEEKLKGDVLNIAARIQDNTPAGSVYISESVYRAVKSKFNVDFEEMGEFYFKNINDPMNLYSVVLKN
jgi:DNA-binding response OmpR family regulator